MEEQTKEAGTKYDAGKNRLDLIPVEALEEEGWIWTMGAEKYGEYNWMKGMKWGRLYGAILRHLFRFWLGEDIDKESGRHHLAHAAWGCHALYIYWLRKLGTDNRLLKS